MAPTPDPRQRQPQRQAANDLLIKGILCAAIGLIVLLAPRFIQTAEMQNIVGASAPVGWFALVLGVALIARWALRRRG